MSISEIRKISAFLIILLQGICLHAQKLSISMTDTTVEAVFSSIRTQTDLDFIFNHEEMDSIPRLSIQVEGAGIDEVLQLCLEGTGLGYKIFNNTIIITPLKEDVSTSKQRRKAQTFRGTVIDADSKLPLPYATVLVMNRYGQQGTSAGADGCFRFERLTVGRYLLKVSYVGYEDAVISEIQLGSAKEVVLMVALEERTEALDELLINYRKGETLNQMSTVSSHSFNVKETKRYPVSVSDPARMVQVFAGITNTDDATNEIVIRGNSPNWLLWRLEGVEIPSPNHFAEEGFSAGAVSILSTNLIGLSDFFTGAFPAEYGNALSGVFDIRLRTGNEEKREYALQAGLLGLDMSAEGPFREGYNGSFLFNYRYSTFSLLNMVNIRVSQNALPNYQDLSFKLNLPSKRAGTFSIWGIGGMADDDERYLPDTTLGEDPEYGYRDFTRSGMYAFGISHVYYPDDRSFIRSVVSNSMSYSSENYQDMDSLGVLRTSFSDDLSKSAIRFSSLYNRKINSSFTFQAGFTYSHLYFSYYSQNNNKSIFSGSFIDSKGKTDQFQAYLQGKYKIGRNSIIKGGIHYNYFALSRSHSLEPRLGFQIRMKGEQKLAFGYGLHSRNENLPVYFVQIPLADGSSYFPNTGLGLTKAHHLVLSYEKMLTTDIQLKAEAYLQEIYKLPVSVNPSKYWIPAFGGVNPGDTLENTGRGRNYGLEITLQKYFTPDFYFLYSGSLFEAKYRPADMQWYDSRYNLNFIQNLVGGKEFDWGENKLAGINLRFIWAGGKRFFPIDLEASREKGYAVLDTNEPFSGRGKNYFRIDLGLKLHIYGESAEHILSLDIQNLSNRTNVLLEDYNPLTQSIIEYPMTALIPIFNYRLEF